MPPRSGSWSILKQIWRHLGRSGAGVGVLETLGAVFVALGVVSEASWSPGRSWGGLGNLLGALGAELGHYCGPQGSAVWTSPRDKETQARNTEEKKTVQVRNSLFGTPAQLPRVSCPSVFLWPQGRVLEPKYTWSLLWTPGCFQSRAG